MTGSNKFALFSRKGAVVDREGHLYRRLGDPHKGQRLGAGGIGEGMSDGDVLQTGDGHDVAHSCFLNGNTLESVELEHGGDLAAANLVPVVVVGNTYFLTDFDHTAVHTADADTAYVLVVVQRGDQHLQRSGVIALRRRDVFQNGLEQGLQILALFVGRQTCGTRSAGAVGE